MSVNWNHEFSPKFAMDLDASQTKDEYAGTRSDTTTNTGLAVNYKFRRWLGFGLKYSNAERTSSNSANNYSDNTVMFSATLLHDSK